jgi:antitoxin ParD1/3/4
LSRCSEAILYDKVIQDLWSMPPRANRPISVTLGPLAARAEARVRSGAYSSVSEVVRAGLRALEREEAIIDAWLRARVEQLANDPRPDIPADEMAAALRARHEARLKRDP